jgi:hypothetical protein
MNLHSKYFDRVRADRARDRQAADADAAAPRCSWEGCEEAGGYRAPVGRGQEGKYRNFCLEHVRAYNKSYNYFAGMSDAAIAAFQKEAIIGHRPTWTMGPERARTSRAEWSGLYDNPFDLFDEGPTGGRPREAAEERPRRHIAPGARKALESLGLDERASARDIQARYKALVKQHHPDANHGDRSSEDRLRGVIAAYTVLKRAGLG